MLAKCAQDRDTGSVSAAICLTEVGLSLCDNRLPEPTKYLLEGSHLLYIADFTWEVNLNKTSGKAVGQLRSHLTDCKSPCPVISTHQIRRCRSLLASICPHFGLHPRASQRVNLTLPPIQFTTVPHSKKLSLIHSMSIGDEDDAGIFPAALSPIGCHTMLSRLQR